MSSGSAPGRTSFAVRLFVSYALAYLILLGVIGWLLFRSGEQGDSTLIILAFGALLGLVVIGLVARRMAAPIAALTQQTHELALSQRGQVAQAEHAIGTLQMVLGALPQGTVLFSADDEVEYSNASAQELLGVVPSSLSGLTPFPFQNAVRECRERRQSVERVVEHGKPVRRLRAVATPFAGDQRILLVLVDVTDLERVASIRRDFVANASHELKTPVSAIIASSEALQIAVGRNDDSSVGFAQQIDRSARQLDRLVADLLDLSRLERDQPEMEPMSLDLLVREEVERLRPAAEEKGIDLTFDLSPTQIAGSRRDIAIAVRNLLDNAVRYTGAGGSAGAALETVDDEVVLRISDNGEGIPTKDLGRVFERFYRVDAARSRSTGGTGLGLAIVKHVVEGHGGAVAVESELGRGSVFTVRLPALNGDNGGSELA
ncbi:MAG TPA: ATP-binding protein [Acidimicrobiia bacterium]